MGEGRDRVGNFEFPQTLWEIMGSLVLIGVGSFLPRMPKYLGNLGFPLCSFGMELVQGAGKCRVPSMLFPNGIGTSAGKFEVPPTLFLDGIGAGCREIWGSLDALPKQN